MIVSSEAQYLYLSLWRLILKKKLTFCLLKIRTFPNVSSPFLLNKLNVVCLQGFCEQVLCYREATAAHVYLHSLGWFYSTPAKYMRLYWCPCSSRIWSSPWESPATKGTGAAGKRCEHVHIGLPDSCRSFLSLTDLVLLCQWKERVLQPWWVWMHSVLAFNLKFVWKK